MALRLPSDLSGVSALAWPSATPYPPRGFAAFEERSLGNGDTFGLYWPIGLENQEPLVCEIVHDEWTMVPAFSDLSAFLRITGPLDEFGPAEWPTLKDDERSPHACFAAAREAVSKGSADEACALLGRSIERLPEYTAALSLLSAQCLRLGKHDEACRYAVRALRSPPSLGGDADLRKTWNWLSRQSQGPDDLADDPIWSKRTALATPPAGGSKQNDVYLVLAEAAAGYTDRGDIRAALSLWQAYAEFIWGETVSFRERYGFTLAAHQERLRGLEARQPTGLRELAL